MELSANLSLDRYQWAAEAVHALIAQNTDAIYYDIGAGEYNLAGQIAPGWPQVKSFDLVPRGANPAEQWDVEHRFPYNYPAPNIVTFLEVVEHLNNPWLCLKNISDMMAPGGHLILTTPNPGWSTSRVSLLTSGFLTCFTKGDLWNHHVFTPWPHIVEVLLNDNDFEIVKYVTLDGKTSIFDKNIKPTRALVQIPLRAIKKLIEKRDPTAKGMSYGIIARKKL